MRSHRVGEETDQVQRLEDKQVLCPSEHAPETGDLSHIEERATQALGRTAITGMAGPRTRGHRPVPTYICNAVHWEPAAAHKALSISARHSGLISLGVTHSPMLLSLTTAPVEGTSLVLSINPPIRSPGATDSRSPPPTQHI